MGLVSISPSQAVKLLCISNLIRDGDIELHGQGGDIQTADEATEAILDIAQEIALQVHSHP